MIDSISERLQLKPLLAALLTLPALAAHAVGPVPGAGTILEQVQPVAPSAPAANNPVLKIEQPSSVVVLPASVSFLVSHIEIAGNTKIETATLHALVADAEGRNLTLPQLGELALRLTDYYHAHGYPLARAIIPVQTLRSGIVKISIIEVRYGAIDLKNHSRSSDRLLQATLGNLRDGDVVSQYAIDRSLLLLTDIPGVAVNAILQPGAAVGTSDLRIDTTATPVVTGNIALDNDGSRYTNRARLGATVNLIEPLHQGDIFSVSGLNSGSGMSYGSASYEALLDGAGTRAGVTYSALDYKLLGPLAPLAVQGSAQVASLRVKQPLILSRSLDFYGQLQYDYLQLNDDIDSSEIQTNRHLDNVTATLSGDSHDDLFAGAVNTWSASWTYGHVSFDNASAGLADAVTANTQGGFSKGNLTLARLQNFGVHDALYLSLAGQWASGNLDESQKLVVGGPNSVRAYDVGAVSGDSGYLFTFELRHMLQVSALGQWQAVVFFDGGHLKVNRNSFSVGANNANLSGVGVGLNWSGPNQLSASATLAVPLGTTPEEIGSRASVRAWLQLDKAF